MGLEIIFQLYKDSSKTPFHDVFILIHSTYLENNLKCIGKTYDQHSLKSSELLPSGWNDNLHSVELFYINTSKDVFKTILLNENGTCLLHLMTSSSGNDKSEFIEFLLDDYVSETDGRTLDEVYKSTEKLEKLIVDRLLKPLDLCISERQKNETTSFHHSFPDRSGPYRGQTSSSRDFDPLRDYGRADLDPFHGRLPGAPGGMVFDPFRHVGPQAPDRFSGLNQPLPRGSVPPGARFDPFGPPGSGFPDPDIEKRPHFNDDFYS